MTGLVGKHQLDLQYVGSFQKGEFLTAESPLEEIWSRVARLGNADYTQALTAHANPPITVAWEDFGPYGIVRVRQAVELRNASRAASLLTRALPLYYSFLNLTRGCLALGEQVIASKKHGLTFDSAVSLLNTGAKLSKGTFADFLSAHKVPFVLGTKFTLRDCLARIVEIAGDFSSFGTNKSLVAHVGVRAWMSGTIVLTFHSTATSVEEFRAHWQEWLPTLGDTCELEPEGASLRVISKQHGQTHGAVADYLEARLWPPLIVSDSQNYWALLETTKEHVLPRSAYYFVALFILGSVVRYEPELLLEITAPGSDLGWLLTRFLNASERFFPQLMLHFLFANHLYVST